MTLSLGQRVPVLDASIVRHISIKIDVFFIVVGILLFITQTFARVAYDRGGFRLGLRHTADMSFVYNCNVAGCTPPRGPQVSCLLYCCLQNQVGSATRLFVGGFNPPPPTLSQRRFLSHHLPLSSSSCINNRSNPVAKYSNTCMLRLAASASRRRGQDSHTGTAAGNVSPSKPAPSAPPRWPCSAA